MLPEVHSAAWKRAFKDLLFSHLLYGLSAASSGPAPWSHVCAMGEAYAVHEKRPRAQVSAGPSYLYYWGECVQDTNRSGIQTLIVLTSD